MPNWLLSTQEELQKFHPAFIKGLTSILIGAFTFLTLFFGSDEAMTYITASLLFWIKGICGLGAIILNQFRDALSAYYTDKQPKPEVPLDSPQPPIADAVVDLTNKK